MRYTISLPHCFHEHSGTMIPSAITTMSFMLFCSTTMVALQDLGLPSQAPHISSALTIITYQSLLGLVYAGQIGLQIACGNRGNIPSNAMEQMIQHYNKILFGINSLVSKITTDLSLQAGHPAAMRLRGLPRLDMPAPHIVNPTFPHFGGNSPNIYYPDLHNVRPLQMGTLTPAWRRLGDQGSFVLNTSASGAPIHCMPSPPQIPTIPKTIPSHRTMFPGGDPSRYNRQGPITPHHLKRKPESQLPKEVIPPKLKDPKLASNQSNKIDSYLSSSSTRVPGAASGSSYQYNPSPITPPMEDRIPSPEYIPPPQPLYLPPLVAPVSPSAPLVNRSLDPSPMDIEGLFPVVPPVAEPAAPTIPQDGSTATPGGADRPCCPTQLFD